MTVKSISSISPLELAALRKEKGSLELIDVRTPGEFEAVHAEGARSLPLDHLDPKSLVAERGSKGPLYLICQSGGRGQKACQMILEAGFEKAVNVEGGTAAWERAGLPVVRGRKTISLERQVRIAAGLLVLLGGLLGLLVHPYWIGISLFVGAGLTFAGITDTCGMGLLLAKMPWNR